MNANHETAAIQSCGALPVLSEKGDSEHHHICDDAIHAQLMSHQVFPGMRLTFIDIYSSDFDSRYTLPREGMLEILYCSSGRVEYEQEGEWFFLDAGDVSVHPYGIVPHAVQCTTQPFRGLSVRMDPMLVPPCTSAILPDVKVSLTELFHRFEAIEAPVIMRATPQMMNLFETLFCIPDDIQQGFFKIKVLELLLVLSSVLSEQTAASKSVCTPQQVLLVQEAMRYVEAHYDRHVRAEELAAALKVSLEQLRRSVRLMYGQPLAQWVRMHKMRLAAQMLCETDRTVADVASAFGYDNSSKFARAFRQALGVSPMVYRRKLVQEEMNAILERKNLILERKTG